MVQNRFGRRIILTLKDESKISGELKGQFSILNLELH